jgi:superfamily II DNA or RNA helicase
VRIRQNEQPLRVGWVSQRKNLLDQTDRENTVKNIHAKVEFLSMFEKNPAKYDMLIIDECQHDACDSCAHIHNTVRPKYILGLSGTPFRSDRVKLCFDKVVKDAGIKVLIEQGYLSQYHHYTIDEYDPEYIARLYATEQKRWGKSAIYFHTIKQCMLCQEVLDTYDIESEVVTGSSDRYEQIERLESGDINVLLNCMVLTEGFNMPSLKTVFCKPSCKGVTIQIAGRAFRKYKDYIKNVVQCKRTPWTFLRTVLPKMQFIREDEEWRSIGINDNVKCASQNVVKSLAKINIQLPKLLTAKKVKKQNSWRNFASQRVITGND